MIQPQTPISSIWVDAILEHRFGDLAGPLAPDVAFRALVPRGLREAATSNDAIAWVERWFGDADVLELEEMSGGEIADRSWFRYRFRAHKPEGWKVIEQQIYATLADGRIAALDLLCSGFRTANGPEEADAPKPDASVDAIGADCATLIPTLARSMREIPVGGVLDIVTDDPTAQPSLEAWSRLTGHELISGSDNHWYIRRQES